MDILNGFPTSVDGYRIELAKKNRLEEIVKFFKDHYHRDEPMSKGLRAKAGDIYSEEELKLIEEDEGNMIAAMYESSPCLIAIYNETEEIVGVVLTATSTRPEDEDDGASSAAVFNSYAFKTTFVKNYYNYFSQIDKAASIFKKYPNAEVAVELCAIVVHNEHRQKGLGTDLSLNGLNLAKCMPGVGVIYGICTSIHSKKVAERIGMKTIMDFDLETDFIDENGDPAFCDTEPNNIVSLMAFEVGSE